MSCPIVFCFLFCTAFRVRIGIPSRKLTDLLRLAAHHQVHGGEELLLTAGDQAVTSQGQTVGRLLRAPREKTDGFKGTNETVGKATAPPGHPGDGQEVPGGRHVLEGAREGEVPGDLVGSVGQILVVLELEAGVADGVQTLGDADHVGDAVTLLDTETNLAVLGVVVVVLISHKPLVHAEDAAGLQHAQDLLVHALELGGVDGGLNGVDGIEAIVGEAHLHKVALDEAQLVAQTLALGVAGGALDLVVVVVQTDDVGVSELDDLARGATDTTADIQDPHAGLDVDLVGEVVLMAGNGLVEGLALGEAAEMERGAPAVLVEISRKVVVTACTHVSIGMIISTREGIALRHTVWSGWHIRRDGPGIAISQYDPAVKGEQKTNCPVLTARVSSVSSAADLLSQCLKYSSTAASCAAVSLPRRAARPP